MAKVAPIDVLETNEDTFAVDINFSESRNVDYVVAQLGEFRDKRNTKKNAKFVKVWELGMTFLVLGMILYEIFNYCVQIATSFISQVICVILACVFMAISVTGVVVCSTVDPSKVDYDSVVGAGGASSVFFRITTSFITVVNALSWYGVCAIPAIILAFYNLIFIIPFRWLPMKYTTRFISSMVLDELLSCVSYIYNSYESATDGNYSDRFIWGIKVNDGYPYGSVFFETWIALAVVFFLEFVFLLGFWMHQRRLMHQQSDKAMNPTTIMYISYYMWLNRYGLQLMMRGAVCLYYAHRPDHKGTFVSTSSRLYNVTLIVTGLLSLLPPVGLSLLGPSNVFNFTARAFDRNIENLKEDGKFIAELLEGVDVMVGDIWWVHYDKINQKQRMEYTDHRKNWYKGLVTELEETHMTVTVPDMTVEKVTIPRKAVKSKNNTKSATSSDDDMLDYASKNLRCIDWESINEDLFTKSVRDNSATSLYSLSRPLRDKEAISYFISHAWDDNGGLKYQKLKALAESYKSSYSRYPTFWFDKVCFDQANISDGLKVLPINVMSCQKLLVLYGKQYSTRLWCIWELFVMFSFADVSEAQKRLTIVPLEDGVGLNESLASFDSCNAHCYDPNEEAKLRQVISAAGSDGHESEFNVKIRKLAQYVGDSASSKNTVSSLIGVTLGRKSSVM